MFVIKRNNQTEKVSFDKIFNRIQLLASIKGYELSDKVNTYLVCQKTIEGMTNNIETTKLDKLSADICANLITSHSEYAYLGSRILISNLKKNMEAKHNVKKFSDITELIVKKIPNYLNDEYIEFIRNNRDILDGYMNDEYDFLLDYFGFKTLEKSYLIKDQKSLETLETIQSLWLRVAITVHMSTRERSIEYILEKIKNTYSLLGQGKFIHATPTLFNAGTNHQQLSSCFLLGTEDSVEGIFKTMSDCGQISKWAGGIGLHVSNIRSKGQLIKKTNGISGGLVPMLQVYNHIGRFINQGKRNGSIAIYLEPHHPDILDFVDLRRPSGNELDRCRDLFLALWISDLFMKAVYNNEKWYLMSEDDCPNLSSTHGDEFEKLYNKYVEEKRYVKEIDAKNLWNRILASAMETGTPYILFKDHVNKKSMQANLGTIKSSNLCVSGNTLILTSSGYLPIKDLKDQHVKVWNGLEWSETIVRQTGTNKDLIKVSLSNGTSIDCTPEHNFYIRTGCHRAEEYAKVSAKDLKPFDCMINYRLPEFLPDWNSLDETLIYLEEIIGLNSEGVFTQRSKESAIIDNKLHIKSTKKDILINFRYMLHGIGIESIIKDEMMCDGDSCYKSYSLIIDSKGIYRLKKLGLKISVIDIELDLSNYEEPEVYVTSVSQGLKMKNQDTYCFTESKRGMGMFNGILTGQCAEIVEYSDEKEYAVCNLASIALNKFYDMKTKTYDYEGLHEVSKHITYNLNNIIDINYYPTKETSYSNLKNRPIGIGIQGFADLLAMMNLPFESDEAINLSGFLQETIYHGALEMSNELAKKYGPYDSYNGSPISRGLFQFDLWNLDYNKLSGKWNWTNLRDNIIEFGVRNSLTCALMPTASTSQILGNNECFEPFTSNLYTRLTLAGNFIVFNKHLQRDLEERGLWNENMKNKLMASHGSIQKIDGISQDLKNVYKTAWEIKQKAVIDHAIRRGPFVDQSQSMNLFFEKPDAVKLTSALMYGWKNGLKTGMYYLRSQPSVNAQQFTVEPIKKELNNHVEDTQECTMCSS